MLGKQKCRILKEIRQRIADENDIPYVTRECSFQGECRGTCPRCESELRYLEHQLALRASLKKGVTVAALCAGMAGLSFAASGCSSSRPAVPVFGQNDLSGAAPPEEIELSGEVDSSYYEYSGQEATSESALQAASSESALQQSAGSADSAQCATAQTALKFVDYMEELTGDYDDSMYRDSAEDDSAQNSAAFTQDSTFETRHNMP